MSAEARTWKLTGARDSRAGLQIVYCDGPRIGAGEEVPVVEASALRDLEERLRSEVSIADGLASQFHSSEPNTVKGLGARIAATEAERDAARAEAEQLREPLGELAKWAEEARAYYGVEECAGPGQAATEWDEIQEGLQMAAMRARAALAATEGKE